ncbi:winged helix-turn-helix domain-containing protein [Alcanivorax jadensis]|uniref:winged helix-turn-helix domain-containing protein n=1 Tax=Alcanivorax jadensis TaxID=64988 RepID=UPI002355D39F|nr:winged helix-turn-helix domain-containing protein [Alcanivorax jadensis]|tara:strand:- start:16349 stop:16609 length:261 start_codon:yes stop_codon:yes gene_type:complete
MTHTDRILTLLQDGPMSRGEIAKCLGLPGKKTQWVLVNMRAKGLVELIGEGRFSRWCLAGQAPNNVADLVAQHEQSAVARYLSGAL